MKLLSVPHPSLLKKSSSVTHYDAKLHKIIHDMEKILVSAADPVGVGLAGNQVGVLLRIFLMRPVEKGPITVFINPRILRRISDDPHAKDTTDEPLEGCLSVPRIWAPVRRDWQVELEWHDKHGSAHSDTFTGFESAVVQHEIDHLDGILFTIRATQQGSPIYEERGGKLHEVRLL